MVTGWLIAMVSFAVMDWAAVARGWRFVRYVTKPAALLALMVWFWQLGGGQGFLLWFLLALVFSWLGDVFLLLPDRFFQAGLVSFLLAHIFYLVGFNLLPPRLSGAALILLAVVAVAIWAVVPRVVRGVRSRPETRPLTWQVLAYSAVISLMLYSALLNLLRPDWPLASALVTAAGAALFFTSDYILATKRFVRSLPYDEVAVIVTYHLGQLAIIWGVLMAFSGLTQS